MDVELSDVSIDFLILADRVETLNGKLYMMGGGWEHTFAENLEQPVRISMAIGLLVPWHATNQEHRLGIAVEDSDGQAIDFSIDAGFTAGRPPISGTDAGITQRLNLSIIDVPVPFPKPGGYVIVASLNGKPSKRVPFRVALVGQQVAPA